jgi:hypothetical protein
MNQMLGLCLPASQPGFTPKQGQYLVFIHAYTLVLGRPPAEADLQRFYERHGHSGSIVHDRA